MAAYKMYTIHGKASSGNDVSIDVKLLATPEQSVIEFMLREIYPSATKVYWTGPAAHGYPKPEKKPVTAKSLATTPVRRAG